MNFFSLLMIMMLNEFLNKIVSNFSTIERSVLVWLLGTFFGELKSFSTFPFFFKIPKMSLKNSLNFFLPFLLFFKLQNN